MQNVEYRMQNVECRMQNIERPDQETKTIELVPLFNGDNLFTKQKKTLKANNLEKCQKYFEYSQPSFLMRESGQGEKRSGRG